MRLRLLLALLLGASIAAQAQPENAGHAFQAPSLYHVGFWVRDIAKARAFYKDYLGYEEPYELHRPNGDLQMVVMKVNERQVIYLFTDATKILPNGDNLDHLGLETDAIETVRTHLLANGIKVGAVGRGRIGDLLLGVKDPDGHTFEFTQFMPEGQLLRHQGKSLAPGRVSDHLRSATLTVADLATSLHFYVDVLGFKRCDTKGIVRVQVPDGADYLVLQPYSKKPDGVAPRAVPEYRLDVADAAKTAALLTARAKTTGFAPPTAVQVGADGCRQTSVVDPDGTRIVLAEKPAP